jgi:hypothetical protein
MKLEFQGMGTRHGAELELRMRPQDLTADVKGLESVLSPVE